MGGGSGRAMDLSRAQRLCASLPHRVFGNSWDSDEDAPSRFQSQRHVPKVADSDGYCSHSEDGTNGEPGDQRGTAPHQGQPAVAAFLVGRDGAWGLWEVQLAGEKDFFFFQIVPCI